MKSSSFSAWLLGCALVSSACEVEQDLSGPDAQVDASCGALGSATVRYVSTDGSIEVIDIDLTCEDAMSELPGIPAPELEACDCETK